STNPKCLPYIPGEKPIARTRDLQERVVPPCMVVLFTSPRAPFAVEEESLVVCRIFFRLFASALLRSMKDRPHEPSDSSSTSFAALQRVPAAARSWHRSH